MNKKYKKGQGSTNKTIKDSKKTRLFGSTSKERVKPIRRLFQIDCWIGDTVHRCDKDDHVIVGDWKDEPRNSDFPVRIQIINNASKFEIITLLRKATKWLQKDWNELFAYRFPEATEDLKDLDVDFNFPA